MAANDIYSKNWRHIHNISELLLGGAQAHMDLETSLSASEGIVIVPLDVGEVIPPQLWSATRYWLCLLAQRTLGL